MGAPTLTTERLVLRQIRIDDAPELFPALSDADQMRWWSSGPHGALAETEAYLVFNAAEDQDHLCWAITRGGDDAALGWVILMEKRTDVAEIGYILRRDAGRRGFARESVSAVIDFAFSTLCLRRISADVDPDNAASLALLERLGFQREGLLREEWETHIGVRDSLIYGLLRDDWRVTQ